MMHQMRPQKKIDKDMGREVEKLGGYRPQAIRLAPRGGEMAPRRGVAYMEIVDITILASPRSPRRKRNRLYRRGL